MQDQFVDIYRNSIRTAAELTRVSLENAVRLQERQLEIARKVVEDGSRSLQRLSEAKSVDELIAAQNEFAGAQMQRVAQFWTQMWQTVAENQTRSAEDVARAAASQVSRAAGSLRESATAANQERKAQEAHRKSA